MKTVIIILACASLGFCTTQTHSHQSVSSPAAFPVASRPPSLNASTVLVFDQGFDTTHEVFKNKISATYTLDCPGGEFELLPPKFPKDFTNSSFEKKKEFVKQQLASRLKSCHMREGLDPINVSVPANLLEKRAAYNVAVQNGTEHLSQSFRELQQWLDPLVASGKFHGTATAGLIASKNDVNLVLVSIRLATSEAFAQFSICPNQSDINALGKIFDDPNVLKIFIDNDVERIMKPIFTKHRVDYANLSAGVLPRKTLERFYTQLGCKNLSLKPLYQIFERLTALSADSTDEQTIAIMAAGNENTNLNSAADGALCPSSLDKEFLVGSIGKTGVRSAFSNFGRCVRFYAPGEQVVVPFIRDFYVRQSGTSFSAPYVTRLLTNAPRTLQTAKKRIEWLSKQADNKGHIK